MFLKQLFYSVQKVQAEARSGVDPKARVRASDSTQKKA